jgi:hypothetical protein
MPSAALRKHENDSLPLTSGKRDGSLVGNDRSLRLFYEREETPANK